jgi:uncharacterized protein (TIGR00725 family)
MMDKKKFITVIGSGDCSPQEARMAEEVGKELARHGAVLVCGGLGGVMAAACRGATMAGGLTIGILPGDSRRSANPYVQIPIVTNLGEARNVIVVKTAQAVIAIGGGYGTLSEIGHALKNNIPVVGLNTWQLFRDGIPEAAIITAKDPADAVHKAISLI